ncbi:MAG TPA: hypothetical protein PKD55_01515 [Bellilinea sp.]|nr:hypothetical protein [Bellilinea sp.]
MKERYPDDLAQEKWVVDNKVLYLVQTGMGHWCGYVRFETRPVAETGYGGFMTYVPVHGGITYAGQGEDGTMVYGFDCAHAGDEEDPKTWDMNWLRAETERMAIAIEAAVPFSKEYDAIQEGDNEARAEVIDRYHRELQDIDIRFDLQNNFGAMIRFLFGEL